MPIPTVIIPVFNAFEHLEACLGSIRRTVPADTRILLIDDASTDRRVLPLLRSFADESKPYRQLIKHESNKGFVATANHGMRMADTDMVLLNSDTEVTNGWLQQLADCLASNPSIATATPWSNNGEIVSIPDFCVANPVPANPEAIASVIASCGQAGYPDMPTAVGFCMAISLRAVHKVGYFDEVTFGRGYGEENDFCQRAEQSGFRNVLCDNAYVLHHGGASFGPLDLKPDEQSMQRLLAKHPDYHRIVSEFIRTDPFAPRRREILDCLEQASVLHRT